jgi:PAS domain S-box-containing protein
MWTFHEMPDIYRRLNWGIPFSFRVKLTIVLMVVVFAVTICVLYFAQRAEQTTYQQNLKEQFHSRLAFLFGAQDARDAEVSEQCRALARVVRIQAALEEGDVDDLYANAKIELRNVMEDENPSLNNSTAAPPRAAFFRFLSADGKLLLPPGSPEKLEPWEEQLVTSGIGSANQQFGYVAVKGVDGDAEVSEIVCTPILGPEGELLATLVLGFPPVDLAVKPDSEIKTGIWLNGELHLAGLAPADREALAAGIAQAVQFSTHEGDSFTVQLRGESYLLFYKILNPRSRFPPAYEVCLYSLAASQAEQQRVRWKIVAIAALVLVVGLGASHSFSARISRPVEQLAEVSARNVARREEAEAARDMTELRYRSIFENAVEGIFLLGPDGRYLSANPAMARIFGFESAVRLVADWAYHPEKIYVDRERGQEFLRRLKTDGIVSNFECEVRRKDGRALWISQNARAIHNATGELLHIEGTMEDVTERKQAADSLAKLNTELGKALADLKATQNQVVQQERLRALGQMASGIAHDFNNSLMPVMGFAELLLARPDILDDKKKATEYLEIIRTAAKDAASVVARLREFYRTQEQTDIFAPIDLSRLSQQAISLTQPKWKDQAQANGAEIHIVEELVTVPAISGDESALREVLTNLIFNAVDAMPRGGSITLRTRVLGESVFLEVADTGAGMTEEVRQRCLEPFFTTKGERGTGLGLAMVFGIVQRHGGDIDIHSQTGRGTTFILRFPMAAAVTPTTATKTAELPVQRAWRVLLVEDDPQVRQVLTAFLEMDGHSVQGADHGTRGLSLFSQENFDLVITDKAMPGMSGDQMAVEIKRISPKMPVVLLSGFNSTGESEKIPGVDVIASKPITMPALRAAIRKAMQMS